MKSLPMTLILAVAAQAAMAGEAKVAPQMSKDLAGIPGKESLMITVEYAPGQEDPIHRHNAQAFVYVLQGSVVMQVRSWTDLLRRTG